MTSFRLLGGLPLVVGCSLCKQARLLAREMLKYTLSKRRGRPGSRNMQRYQEKLFATRVELLAKGIDLQLIVKSWAKYAQEVYGQLRLDLLW